MAHKSKLTCLLEGVRAVTGAVLAWWLFGVALVFAYLMATVPKSEYQCERPRSVALHPTETETGLQYCVHEVHRIPRSRHNSVSLGICSQDKPEAVELLTQEHERRQSGYATCQHTLSAPGASFKALARHGVAQAGQLVAYVRAYINN